MSIEELASGDAGEQGSPAPDEGKQQTDPAIESRAREMGWVPETEWKGPPPKGGFRPAEEFVQRGEEVLPIVRAEVKRKDERIAELETKLDRVNQETADKISRMEKMSETALKRQRQQIEEKYEDLKVAAVETGDRKAYDEANKAQREALSDFDKQTADEPDDDKAGKTEKKKIELPREITETVEAWTAANPWFTSDAEMHKAANAYHEYLLKAKPGLTLKQNLDKVREHVAKEFPSKFEAEREEEQDDDFGSKRGSPVEGGTRLNGGGSRSLFGKLPKEAQAQADRFIKEDGLFLEKGETVEKNINAARERYAREYLGEQA